MILALAGWRDVALIIIMIIHIVITAIMLVIAFFAWRYSNKGFNALDKLIQKRVRPALDQVELQLVDLRERTTRLPGSGAVVAVEAPKKKKGGGPFPLPFRRKRRRFPLLPS
jgi:hypothetical protein